MISVWLTVCQSVRVICHFRKYSQNASKLIYMLFRFIIACFLFKIVYIRFIIRMQGNKRIRMHYGQWEFFMCILTSLHCTKHNKINIHFEKHKNMFSIDNVLKNIDDYFTGSHKWIRIRHILWMDIVGTVFCIVLGFLLSSLY